VPFVEHANGVDFIPKFDSESEDPLDDPDEHSIWYDKSKNHDKKTNMAKKKNNAITQKHEIVDEKVDKKENINVKNGYHLETQKQKDESKPIETQEIPELDVNKINYKNLSEEHEEVKNNAFDIKNTFEPKEAIIPKLVAFKPFKGKNLSNKLRSLLRKGEREEHGFQHLPQFVRFAVVALVAGMFVTIVYTARFGLFGGGKGKKKGSKKKKNAQPKTRSL